MEDMIKARIFVLGDNIDTDQIIPAQYLNLLPSRADELRELGRYALSGLPKGTLPFVEGDDYKSRYNIIVAGKNFGCGSSREHAPVSLSAAGVVAIVAQSYSRIFFRNSINTGLIFPFEVSEQICDKMSTGDEVELDISGYKFRHLASDMVYSLNSLGEGEAIIKSGGIFGYAKRFL